MNKAQGSLEYLVIIAAVLLVSGIVVYLISGSAGSSVNSVNFEQCKTAANQCRTNHLVNAHDPCNFCEKACTVNGKDILNDNCSLAVSLCKQGNPSEIYVGNTNCSIGCVPTEQNETNCNDGLDNDCNGMIDCADPNCISSPACVIIANFTYYCNTNVNNFTCNFNASSSEDLEGNISSYEWDFGDNTTGGGEVISHIFSSSGTYNVSLTVKDNEKVDTASQQVVLNFPPSASFIYSCNSSTGTCNFNASNSTDPDGTIVSYNWDFGDGSTGKGVTVSHTYFHHDYYPVNLTVIDNDGSNNSYSETIFIPRRWHKFSVENAGFGNAHVAVGFGIKPYIHVFYESNTSGSYFLRHAAISMTNGQKTFLPNVVGDPSQKVVGEISATTFPPFYISYYEANGEDLRVAHTWYTSSGWQSDNELVDSTGNVGRYSSIAFNSNGFPSVSYYDSTNANLKYAWKDGSNWHNITVDSSGNVGEYSSLAFDSNGHPWISYYDSTNGDLKVAEGTDYQGSSWSIWTFDSAGDVGYWSSIAIDSNDAVHIVYGDDGYDLKYLYNGPGSGTVIDDYVNGQWVWNGIAVDSNNYPRIAYNGLPYFGLKYAFKDSNGWHSVVLDGNQTSDTFAFACIAINNGDIAIGYLDQDTKQVKVMAYF